MVLWPNFEHFRQLHHSLTSFGHRVHHQEFLENRRQRVRKIPETSMPDLGMTVKTEALPDVD